MSFKQALLVVLIYLNISLLVIISCQDEYTKQAHQEFDNLLDIFETHYQAFIAIHFDRKDGYRNFERDVLFYEDSIAYRYAERISQQEFRKRTAAVLKSLGRDPLPERDPRECSPDYYDSIFIYDWGVIDIREDSPYNKLGYIDVATYHNRKSAGSFAFYFIWDSGWIYVYSEKN